jgi:hypothetical protein
VGYGLNYVCQQDQCAACPSNLLANPATNTCECPTGLTYCEGGQFPGSSLKCDNLLTSHYNCGACGNSCGDESKYPTGSMCNSGACGCPPGYHTDQCTFSDGSTGGITCLAPGCDMVEDLEQPQNGCRLVGTCPSPPWKYPP